MMNILTLEGAHEIMAAAKAEAKRLNAPGLIANLVEEGFWQTPPLALSLGRYAYKFVLDGTRWLDDPANPAKVHDGVGGFNSVLHL